MAVITLFGLWSTSTMDASGTGGLKGGALVVKPEASTPARAPVPVDTAAPSSLAAPSVPLGHPNDDKPLEIKPSHYANVWGREPWEEENRRNLELHNLPTNDWLVWARGIVDRCDLSPPPEAGEDITIVTALLDLGRGKSDSGSFKRPITVYTQRLQQIMNCGFPMVIFLPHELRSHLTVDETRVKIIDFNITDLQTYFPYWERLQKIRTCPLQKAQGEYVGYLKTAPQSILPGYNPLVMSKVMLLRDAAKSNPWHTKYHLWLDAGHPSGPQLRPGKMKAFTSRMDKMLVTYWPYGTTTEVHGMTDKAMHMYLGTSKDPMQIVRGGVFGGTLPYITCVSRVYLRALHTTLSEGYLGTEENILAIIYKHFPELFIGFDNDSLGNHGDNNALFQLNQREG